jgi:O-antigen/teichoic acid export membrane protein
MVLFQALIRRGGAVKQQFLHDSLFRNAIYLVMSTAIMGILGFVFWILVAHWYKPESIGIASALISVATLLSGLSLLGVNAGLIRFLPSSKNQSRDINAASLAVAVTSIAAAILYIILAPHLGIKLSLLSSHWEQFGFIVLMAVVSLNSLTDAVFIGNRRGEYHTAGYATFSIVKLAIPLFLISFGSLGVFAAYVLAMVASLAVSYYLMIRGLKYRFLVRPNWSILKTIRGYATNNYLGVVLSNVPTQLLPLFIIRKLGAAEVAYFAMASTMANLLYIVPTAASQSLLAETAHDPSKQADHLKQIVRLLSYMLLPLVTLAIVAAPYLLSIFGVSYRENGTAIFRLLALCTFFVTITTIGNTILNIERHTRAIVATQALNLIITGLASIWLIRFGLWGVGLALLMGYLAATLCHIYIYIYYHKEGEGIFSLRSMTIPIQTLRTYVVSLRR